MTELVSGSASISNLYKNIGWYKGSPVRIASATYSFLDELLNNQVDLVDPTNPFILGLEVSAAQCALAINESLLNLRKSYVGLAQTEQDVYNHLTDAEYIGLFATPGSVDFTFMFDLTSLTNSMVYNSTLNCYQAIIPRDTFHTVDNYVFTHEYPIVISKYPNGVIQITYDTSIPSPLSTPSNNLIQFQGRQDSQLNKYLYFSIPVKQFQIVSSNYVLQKTSLFNKNIAFTDQFLYARVFQKSNATNADWVEITTTHSDQIFDNNTPTAVLKVTTGQLNVTIPYIYLTNGLISGNLRVDLYTTKGNINVSLSNYQISDFTTTLYAIDKIRDINAYTNIWGTVNYFSYSADILSGGANGVSFDTLRETVTNYAFGSFKIPITNAQVNTVGNLNGFTIVPNADGLTDRYFLGIQAIPDITVNDTNTNSQITLARANIGMIRFNTSIGDLQNSDNVKINNQRFTVLSNTVFSLNNGISSLVPRAAINGIKAQSVPLLISSVNAAEYVYTPYYYVFDIQQDYLDMRAFDLDNPNAANLKFILQNQTLILAVNTGSYAIVPNGSGYLVTITTVSGTAFKQQSDGEVDVQLRFVSVDGTTYAYIKSNGVTTNTDGERVYTFQINTNYDVDLSNGIAITNAYIGNTLATNFFTPLSSTVDILYTTSSVTVGFVPDATNALINTSLPGMPVGSVGNNHDQVTLIFGQALTHLWTRARAYGVNQKYQTATTQVIATYETDVYAINPITGSMLFFDSDNNPYYQKLHSQGDQVLDIHGNPVIKYHVGDIILDNNGNAIPVPGTSLGVNYDFDFMVLDGKLLFVTDPNYTSYRTQVIQTITGWITEDLVTIQGQLIERTEIFFYPESSLGITKVLTDSTTTTYINSEQSLDVTVWVDPTILSDAASQANMTNIISLYLDDTIRQSSFTISALEQGLQPLLGTNVYGVTISNLGGEADYKSITVSDQHNRLCLGRTLIQQSDNTISMQDDLNIIFKSFTLAT